MAIALDRRDELLSSRLEVKNEGPNMKYEERMEARLTGWMKIVGVDEIGFILSYSLCRLIVTKCQGGRLPSGDALAIMSMT